MQRQTRKFLTALLLLAATAITQAADSAGTVLITGANRGIGLAMARMELNTFGCCMGYRASKAALNSFTKTRAVDMSGDGMAFAVLHPGYVKTDMNDGAGNISTAESAAGLYTVIIGLDEADNGKFFNYDGKSMPW